MIELYQRYFQHQSKHTLFLCPVFKIALHLYGAFADTLFLFFYKLKVCGNCVEQLFWHHFFFPSSICSFCASVSHFGNSHNISNPPRGRDYDSLEAQMRFRSFCPFSPTPVLLPGKSHGRRSLVGCSPWVR